MNQLKLKKELAESIGQFIEYWGFRNIHGRIWTLVYLAEHPVSTPVIVRELGVSKGLVSIAIGELLDFALLVPGAKIANGAQTYIATEDVGLVVRNILREREMRLLSQTEARLRILQTLSREELSEANVSHRRLKILTDLTSVNRQLLSTVVSRRFTSLGDWLLFLKSAVKILKF